MNILASCKVSEAASPTLQETQSIHDSMNIPKIKFIAYIFILFEISKIICNPIVGCVQVKMEKLNSQRKHGQPMFCTCNSGVDCCQ